MARAEELQSGRLQIGIVSGQRMDHSFSEYGANTQSVHYAGEAVFAQANHCQG